MAGRPRKIIDISTGKIGKEKIKNRKVQEEKLKLGREDLNVPDWLYGEGKKEFERVVFETTKIGILDNLDVGILAIYCSSYTHYIEAEKNIIEKGAVLYKLDKNGNEIEYLNPALLAQEKYTKQIMQCSTKLGLATTDRLKLIIPTKEETKENKFITLMTNRKQG